MSYENSTYLSYVEDMKKKSSDQLIELVSRLYKYHGYEDGFHNGICAATAQSELLQRKQND